MKIYLEISTHGNQLLDIIRQLRKKEAQLVWNGIVQMEQEDEQTSKQYYAEWKLLKSSAKELIAAKKK